MKHINKKGAKERICTVCMLPYPNTREYFNRSRLVEGREFLRTRCKQCEKIHRQEINSTPENTFKSILTGIRNDSKRISKGFDIDLEYLMELYISQGKKCNITKLDLTCEKGIGFSPTGITVDRIDSSKGYIRGNVQILSYWANMSKGAMTMEEFKYFIETTYKNLNYEK